MNCFKAGVVLVVTGVFCTGTALAIQPGKTVTWETPMGKVVFDGKVHRDAKIECLECHSKIFKMKKGANAITMAAINEGKFCGKCHNGKRSFEIKGNCDICHKK